MKQIIKKFLREAGYDIVQKQRLQAADLRNKTDCPFKAKYLANKGEFLINAAPENCITFWRFNCHPNGANPYIRDLVTFLKTGVLNYQGSELEKYYVKFQPHNIKELFNLTGNLHKKLVASPAYGMIFPWENSTIERKISYRTSHVKRETKSRGKELSIDHGLSFHGPITKVRGHQEIYHLKKLANSIKKDGYKREALYYKDIEATVLERNGCFRYLIKDGYHRTAALSALGFKKIPLRIHSMAIPSFVSRDEFKYWPKIISGLYSEIQALSIFDHIFEAKGYK